MSDSAYNGPGFLDGNERARNAAAHYHNTTVDSRAHLHNYKVLSTCRNVAAAARKLSVHSAGESLYPHAQRT